MRSFDISHEISTMRVSKFSFWALPVQVRCATTCDVRNQATRMKIASELPAASAIFRNVPALENLESCVFSTHYPSNFSGDCNTSLILLGGNKYPADNHFHDPLGRQSRGIKIHESGNTKGELQSRYDNLE